MQTPRFENVSCSQCGGSFGPGEHGFSHCDNHQGMSMQTNDSGHVAGGKTEADTSALFDNTRTPRTDGLIARVMARNPGQSARAQADYYEDVHQDLAPLARQMETEIAELIKTLQLVLTGLDNGSVKSKPIMDFSDANADNVEIQSLASVIRAAVAKVGAA